MWWEAVPTGYPRERLGRGVIAWRKAAGVENGNDWVTLSKILARFYRGGFVANAGTNPTTVFVRSLRLEIATDQASSLAVA
jgi:hypothetical protein